MSPADETGMRVDPARRVVGAVLSVGIIAAAIIAAVYVTRIYYVYPRTDDAYVRANMIAVAPHVSGPIVQLPIVDNQYVKQGQLLFVVDPRPYQATLDQLVAKLQLTNLEIKAYTDAINAAQAEQKRREADLAYDKQYLGRIEPLLARHFVTANDVFDARSRVHAAEAGVDNAQSEVRRAQNQLGQLGDINTRRKAVEAEVEDARLNVNYCYVHAPFDGLVTNLNISVGQYANEGKDVLSLVDDRTWYVMANFRENFLDHIRVGMSVDVYLLSYPETRFRGRVQGVGWALYQENGATVQGLPAVEPTLNWVRLSQRFPVRIVLENRDRQRPFRTGQTAVVTVEGFKNEDGQSPTPHLAQQSPPSS